MRILRITLMILPTLVLVIAELFSIFIVAVKSILNTLVGIESYWDLDNEWFQVKQELETWRNNWLQ